MTARTGLVDHIEVDMCVMASEGISLRTRYDMDRTTDDAHEHARCSCSNDISQVAERVGFIRLFASGMCGLCTRRCRSADAHNSHPLRYLRWKFMPSDADKPARASATRKLRYYTVVRMHITSARMMPEPHPLPPP